MVAVVVVVDDEDADLRFQIAGQEVEFKQCARLDQTPQYLDIAEMRRSDQRGAVLGARHGTRNVPQFDRERHPVGILPPPTAAIVTTS